MGKEALGTEIVFKATREKRTTRNCSPNFKGQGSKEIFGQSKPEMYQVEEIIFRTHWPCEFFKSICHKLQLLQSFIFFKKMGD